MPDVTTAVSDQSERELRPPDVFELLSNRRRRNLLTIVGERADGLTTQDLATLLVSQETDQPLHEVSDEQRSAMLTSLQHSHLPRLQSWSLVAVADDGTITLSESAAPTADSTDHELLSAALALEADETVIETTFEALASEKRLTVIGALRDAGELSAPALVEQVTQRDESTAEDTRIALHHRHLPKLADLGIIEYDSERGRVSYEGLPLDDAAWLDGVFADAVNDDDEAAVTQESTDIWTIEGRDNVVERGQELFDRADDELFLMMATDGLLEPVCVEKLHDALDRGVDIYLGSQTSEVRDLVREEVPGVTIWEPQQNWLNLPPSQETLGRIVMADREAVMLGTLGTSGTDGTDTERALTGEGHANPLVILMRETLGERLDQLDGQSDDILSRLPL